MKYLSIIFSAVLLLISSCGTEPEEANAINPNIIKIKDCCDDKSIPGNYYLGYSIEDQIITTGPITKFTVDEDLNITDREDIWRDIIENFENPFGTGFYFTVSSLNEVLITKSIFGDVSLGALYEYDNTTKGIVLLRDSTYNISTAVYFHEDDSKLVYYSYGNENGLEAGYYLHDKTTT
ncbi:MAG: hypothetical protein ABJR05_12585, partial [Balneola sp.]